jgi:SAM-dependent methyltransferase
MGFYEKYVLPRIIHCVCGMKPNMRQREKIIPLAKGRVLEIGVGSGLNLPFYDAGRVTHLWALDPSPELLKMARPAASRLNFPVEFVPAPAETIPLDDESIDEVVITYTLCSISDVPAALAQARRVLRPGGLLHFCEHGLAPEAHIRKWQNRLNGLWRTFSGGCNLNRDIPLMLRTGNFKLQSIDTMYLPGWKPATFNFWGTARAD